MNKFPFAQPLQKSIKLVTALALLLSSPGCSHWGQQKRSELEDPIHVANYLAAMDLLKISKTAEACLLLKELSEGGSPLKNIASLRRELNCADFRVDLKGIPSWYGGLTRQIQKKRAPQPETPTQSKSLRTWQDKLANFRSKRDFQSAIDLLQTRIAAEKSDDEQFQLFKTLRQVYKTAQNRKAYLETGDYLLEIAKRSFEANPQDNLAIRRLNEAYVLNSKAYWTDNYIERAKIMLDEGIEKLKNKYSLQELYYIKGAIFKEQKDFTAASENFQLALKEIQNSPDVELRLLWSEAWILAKLDKKSEARELFKRYSDRHPDNLEKFRGQFWAARMIKDSQTVLSKTEFEDIAKKDLLGFYGLISLRELGNKIPNAGYQRRPLEQIENEQDRKLVAEARDLLRVQENSSAARLINHLQIKINRYTLFAYDPELVFPKLYSNEIKEASEKSKIRPEFIYGIIRQESAFDPEARSQADALGLMQLLPSVAETIAQENKIEFKEAFDLYKPRTNILLGSFELKKLMTQHKNKPILAIARYNASEEALNGWLKTRYSPDPIEFIEEIGYDETRNYVKLVLRNQISYQRLEAKQEFPFPEELLSWSLDLPSLK